MIEQNNDGEPAETPGGNHIENLKVLEHAQRRDEFPKLERRGGRNSERNALRKSIMREYLEATNDTLRFSWAGGATHHHFGGESPRGLKWERTLCDKKKSAKAFVDQYRREDGSGITFSRSFAVKEIRVGNARKQNEKAVQEVEIHRYLYHPHVTAFLGTFIARERLHIMIYPAACGDLRDFMLEISDYWKRGQLSEFRRAEYTSRSNSTRSTSVLSQTGRRIQEAETIDGVVEGVTGSPFDYTQRKKILLLRGWFPCLTQALNYLHETNIRHKDIKPENVLIDSRGSVLLTDFGISRRFRDGVSHITNDQWVNTPEYASPEMMKGKIVPRGDPSDVFSLGCVFIEMASVALERDLDSFREHRMVKVNDTGEECAFHCTLDKVYTWIESLLESHQTVRLSRVLPNEAVNSHDYSVPMDTVLLQVLPHIREMLDRDPSLRPKASKLWDYFKDVGPEKCVDCDQRLRDEYWKPTQAQLEKTQEASQRLSQLLTPDSPWTDYFTQLDAVSEARDPLDPTGSPVNNSMDPALPTVVVRRPTSPTKRRHTVLENAEARWSKQKLSQSSKESCARQELTGRLSNSSLSPNPPIPVETQRADPSVQESSHKKAEPASGIDKQQASTLALKERSLEPMSQPAGPRQSPQTMTGLSTVHDQISSPSTSVAVPVAADNQLVLIHPELVIDDTLPPSPQPALPPHSANPEFSADRDVIIYYPERRMVMVVNFRTIEVLSENKSVKWFDLPRRGTLIPLFEEGDLIARVDLGKLRWWNRLRRWGGHFPKICCIRSKAPTEIFLQSNMR
ncbi:hypothetical protein MMC30_008083 [Trapelia coarctata]|nr:hypothetical protein [Trapelia coarctata]